MKGFPKLIQHNAMDCGPACLGIIARHYGKKYSIPFLRKITHTVRDGSSLLGISKGAEKIGFRTLPVKTDFDKMKNEAPLPLIAHFNNNHFVVVYKFTHNKVLVSDPATGLISFTYNEFCHYWAEATAEKAVGVYLLLETTPDFDKAKEEHEPENHFDTKAFLFHYLNPHKRLMLQVLLSLIVASIFQLGLPFLTQNLVDNGILDNNMSFIWFILIAQLMLTVGQFTLELIRSWTLLYISNHMSVSLISDFFAKLMKLPIRYFDTRLTGDLMQRIADHSRIQSFLTGTSLNIIFSVFTFFLYGCVVAFYNMQLFLVFLTGSALYLGWILFFLNKRKKLDYKRFQQSGRINSKIMELINGMQEIKLHNAEQYKRWGLERLQINFSKISVEFLSLEQLQGIGSRIINEVKNILITVLAARLVMDGKITLGSMLSISFILGQMNAPVSQFVSIIKSWQDARLSLARLGEIHTKETERQEYSEEEDIHNRDSLITFNTISLQNVWFRYEELTPYALKDISFNIPTGKITAIVGSSGSGKSTLLKLLMRFYTPGKGTVKWNDKDLSHINLEFWRNKCGVVMQEGFLFSDTIARNIAIGEEHIDYTRLNYAVNVANIGSFIDSLPLALNTKIGQEGVGVSTGQKQRILIARAVYKNPEIVFLDEATSSLDAHNEQVIMSNIQEFYAGKTVVVVAHRLSTVKHADNIVVLDNGEIVEEGSHYSLIDRKGHYYNLVKNQLELHES